MARGGADRTGEERGGAPIWGGRAQCRLRRRADRPTTVTDVRQGGELSADRLALWRPTAVVQFMRPGIIEGGNCLIGQFGSIPAIREIVENSRGSGLRNRQIGLSD